MSRFTNVPWWASSKPVAPEQEPAADTDYADMGTAFGLDAALGFPPDDPAGTGEDTPRERRPRD